MKEAEIASEYEEDILFNAVQQILLYFLTSLLHFPLCVQDILIQMVCNSGFGFLGVLLLQLANIHPLLPLVPLAFFLVCIHFLLKAGGQKFPKKFQEVAPLDSSSIDTKRREVQGGQETSAPGEVQGLHSSPSGSEPEEELFNWNFETDAPHNDSNEGLASQLIHLPLPPPVAIGASPPAAAATGGAQASVPEDELHSWIAANSIDSSEISIFEPPLFDSSHSSRLESSELGCDVNSFFHSD
jgi:hypothetical protein